MATTTWDQKAGMTSPTDTDNLENYAEQAEAAKDAAAASETAAAASAAAAAASEIDAESAEANAATSAAAASGSASSAASSATAAASSATSASSSETAAAASETGAATSATNAATSATSASGSASSASTDASAASTSATASAASATAASASETNAAASETAAATSEANAAASETAAATSATNAATSETNAAASEANAASSEAAAATSASAASTSAANAATSETNSASSATAAASSATSASASADAALAALDSFDDRYLGQKASDPALDNDGNALVAGALYFNATDDIMKVYDGSVWVAAYASLSGALLQSNNLSDVLDVAASRTNLGLGTAATTASTAYATAAQGALADSAVQPNDSPSFGSVTVTGTVDGRDVAADGSKLDGIEAGADVTDTANVTAAGALMDSEVTNLAQVKAFSSADYATAAQGSLADSALQSGDNVSALTNDAGYTTNVGDITGVTAGSGITGGGTSGTVTVSHADTSTQASVNNSGTTFIQDITLDTYGHITAIGSATVNAQAFPAGTKMLFQQTSAPTGWTKDTTHDNKALRVVSGTASSGGNSSFTTIFANRTSSSTAAGGSIGNTSAGGTIGNTTAGGTVGATTLTIAQMPSHNHSLNTYTVNFNGAYTLRGNYSAGPLIYTNNTGGSGSHSHSFSGSSHNHSFSGSSHNHSFTGSSHSHTLDMRVQYVDLIIATKD